MNRGFADPRCLACAHRFPPSTQLHVKWNGVHVPGSPYRLKIGKQDADPAAVHAHGKGLERGQTGHKSDFIVDTCNAGAGTLAVTIDGPSKVGAEPAATRVVWGDRAVVLSR